MLFRVTIFPSLKTFLFYSKLNWHKIGPLIYNKRWLEIPVSVINGFCCVGYSIFGKNLWNDFKKCKCKKEDLINI